jgi:small GTP-binding protein
MDGSKGIKIILLGESGVGKTNLINVSAGKKFETDTESSLTSSFIESVYEYKDKKYLYSLWDTAGQERFRSLNKIFAKGAKIVMIVFAIDNKPSFDQIKFWIDFAKDILIEGKYIMALVANKSDLFEEQAIPDEEIIKTAKEYNIKYVITSACTNAEGFKIFLRELIKDYIDLVGPEGEKELYFKLGGEEDISVDKNSKKKKCC